MALARAALGRVEELAEREELPEPVADAARLTCGQRINRLEPEFDGDAADGDEAATARRLRELGRELVAVERGRLADLSPAG